MDKDERTLFIYEKIINHNMTKKRISILILGRQILILVFIIQIIWSLWIHSFVVARIPKPNYDFASYSLVFALALYGIILGKPELISDKKYAKIRQPKALIKNLKKGKMIYISAILLILFINYFIYFKYIRDFFIKDIIARKNIKLETFGVDKLENIFTIRFYIQNISIGVYYAIHPIFEITNADYFMLDRIDKHKKENTI